jgi:hypothetical protein
LTIRTGDIGEKAVISVSKEAEAAIGAHRIVVVGTSDYQVSQATNATTFPFGVSGDGSERNASSYVAADEMAVKVAGIVYLTMSGTGNAGNSVKGTTAGYGIAQSTTDNVWVLGIAMKDWVNLEVIPVKIGQFAVGDAVV